MDIGAFRNCSALTDITIPDGIKILSTEAFKQCSKLTSIILPAGLETIDEWAFSYTGLKTIYFNGTEKQWSAVEKEFGWNNGMRGYEIICTDTEKEEETASVSAEGEKTFRNDIKNVSN
jgi:hypothetical protein